MLPAKHYMYRIYLKEAQDFTAQEAEDVAKYVERYLVVRQGSIDG